MHLMQCMMMMIVALDHSKWWWRVRWRLLLGASKNWLRIGIDCECFGCHVVQSIQTTNKKKIWQLDVNCRYFRHTLSRKLQGSCRNEFRISLSNAPVQSVKCTLLFHSTSRKDCRLNTMYKTLMWSLDSQFKNLCGWEAFVRIWVGRKTKKWWHLAFIIPQTARSCLNSHKIDAAHCGEDSTHILRIFSSKKNAEEKPGKSSSVEKWDIKVVAFSKIKKDNYPVVYYELPIVQFSIMFISLCK